MPKQVEQSTDRETCLKLVSLGYARSSRVRLYGQEVELVSDPFPHDDGGIAVQVTDQQTTSRIVRLPLSVVQVARKAPQKRSA